jgi:hypothetical protein
MSRLTIAVLIAGAAFAQNPRPPGFVRGTVSARAESAFSIRTSAGVVYRYSTDSKTWIERDHERIRTANLEPGETLEVVSDRDPELVRYARMVQVVRPPAPHRIAVSSGGVYRLNPAEALPEFTFTGRVVARSLDSITLRTRFDGDKTIYLRPDTQYLENGNITGSGELAANTWVYVLGALNADHELDAYRIVWGMILEPDKR